jgi:hypothetical protein
MAKERPSKRQKAAAPNQPVIKFRVMPLTRGPVNPHHDPRGSITPTQCWLSRSAPRHSFKEFDVRFTAESGHSAARLGVSLVAKPARRERLFCE